ncbi:hypothetical protein CXG81DRAFT_26055 [Caulochytrium protostelioides]|uniref:Uncharacterized protein n=1 Tax=Caulochytrium protostelioides TaxID=1555241 RepID=A0A4P9X7P1_9FUNG|nr:hypothetical protein CXG81DRAFT_26055 [Caulochytrium protostelioides]|eukprot:RKP01248.1 hypothetical protein CXG81DRAFT_26055 [Caulochytrium protostelioides]
MPRDPDRAHAVAAAAAAAASDHGSDTVHIHHGDLNSDVHDDDAIALSAGSAPTPTTPLSAADAPRPTRAQHAGETVARALGLAPHDPAAAVAPGAAPRTDPAAAPRTGGTLVAAPRQEEPSLWELLSKASRWGSPDTTVAMLLINSFVLPFCQGLLYGLGEGAARLLVGHYVGVDAITALGGAVYYDPRQQRGIPRGSAAAAAAMASPPSTTADAGAPQQQRALVPASWQRGAGSAWSTTKDWAVAAITPASWQRGAGSAWATTKHWASTALTYRPWAADADAGALIASPSTPPAPSPSWTDAARKGWHTAWRSCLGSSPHPTESSTS